MSRPPSSTTKPSGLRMARSPSCGALMIRKYWV
jgi:uncharacterized protein YbbK (DUF523 family)